MSEANVLTAKIDIASYCMHHCPTVHTHLYVKKVYGLSPVHSSSSLIGCISIAFSQSVKILGIESRGYYPSGTVFNI